MERKKSRALLGIVCLVLLAGILLVASCTGATPSPTSTPKPTPAPTTAPKPTQVPTPATTPTPSAASKPAPKPGLISWALESIGAGSYLQAVAIGDAMLKKFDIKLRLLPLGMGIGRMTAARSRNVDFFITGADVIYAREGTKDWAALEWGPQALRQVYAASNKMSVFAPAARGDSGIKKLADLKGKKVPYVAASPSHLAMIEAVLYFAGLTWNDIKKVEFPSSGAAWQALVDGKVDWYPVNSVSAYASQIEAQPGGIVWIPLPTKQENPDGWAKMAKLYPGTFPVIAEVGAGLSKEKPVNTVGMLYPYILSYDWVSEDLAYWQTKVLAESFDLYKGAAKSMAPYNINEVAGNPIAGAPWHNGSIKYLKEIGKWTSAMEQENKKLLDMDRKAQELWQVTIGEAAAKSIAEKDFVAFWAGKRKSAGLE